MGDINGEHPLRVSNDQRELRAALASIRRVFGSADVIPTVWQWRKVPFGPCPRCQWPANTLGPDEQPWHAFCWGNDTPPSSWSEWMRGKVERGEWGR